MNYEHLYCPTSKQALSLSDKPFMDTFRIWAKANKVCNQAGDPVSEDIDSFLIEEQQNIAYPIRLEIPQLLPLLAISLEGLNYRKSVD